VFITFGAELDMKYFMKMQEKRKQLQVSKPTFPHSSSEHETKNMTRCLIVDFENVLDKFIFRIPDQVNVS
jgi:hypothetical protein